MILWAAGPPLLTDADCRTSQGHRRQSHASGSVHRHTHRHTHMHTDTQRERERESSQDRRRKTKHVQKGHFPQNMYACSYVSTHHFHRVTYRPSHEVFCDMTAQLQRESSQWSKLRASVYVKSIKKVNEEM